MRGYYSAAYLQKLSALAADRFGQAGFDLSEKFQLIVGTSTGAIVGAGLLAGLSLPTALHALTMGLMGGMILAIMARASMRRAPGVLQAQIGHKIAFALVMLATVLRVALAGLPEALPVPALLWSLGWTVFAGCAARSVWVPVPHPVLSAARGGDGTGRQAGR